MTDIERAGPRIVNYADRLGDCTPYGFAMGNKGEG